jgi:hypothetical protein
MCFCMFLRLGGASGAPKGRLKGPMGGTLGPKAMTWTYIFAIRIQIIFLSAKSDAVPPLMVGVCGRGGPPRAKAQRTLHEFAPRPARPATSDEVRRILLQGPRLCRRPPQRRGSFLLKIATFFRHPFLDTHFSQRVPQSEYSWDLGAQKASFWLSFWSPFWLRL